MSDSADNANRGARAADHVEQILDRLPACW